MEEKKYILTDRRDEYKGRTLYQVKAVKSFGDVKAGDLGGWVQKEANLSHEGNAWISDRAKVYDDAEVCEDAIVSGSAIVSGNAIVFGRAHVHGCAKVVENAKVFGNAEVCAFTCVAKHAKVFGNAEVCRSIVTDNARIYGNSKVLDDAYIGGDVEVCDEEVWYDRMYQHDMRTTLELIDQMKKAVGYDPKRVIDREFEANQNIYITFNEGEIDQWEYLIRIGYALRESRDCLLRTFKYSLTQKGLEYLGKILSVKIKWQ